MQRSNRSAFLLCLAMVAYMFGCESIDSIDMEHVDQRTVLNNTQENTCDLGKDTLTIKGDKLKVLKGKDLKKKKYQVKVELDGTSYFDGTVTTKGIMTIDYMPSGFGAGTASVYEVNLKDGKEKLLASCGFTIEEPEVEEPEVEEPEVEEPEVEEPEIEDDGGCQICPSGTPIFDSPVCNFIVSAAPSFERKSADCQSIVSMANASGCCGDGPPDPCDFEPPKVEHVGPYPPCDLCRDGDYPNNTGMVLNFLYLGEGSCAQYYKYGLQGNIPTHMCDTVQYFAYEPCGCGEFNVRENECKEKE